MSACDFQDFARDPSRRSTPNLSDLTIDCVAEFFTEALSFLPRTRAIFTFEEEEIDCQKQAEKKDEAKGKFSHA